MISKIKLEFSKSLKGILSLSLLIPLLGILMIGCRQPSNKIRMGCKNFTEQLILGEIIAQVVQKKSPEIPLEKKWGFGSTPLIHQALIHGDIDLYIEYSGTAEQLILKSQKSLSVMEIDQIYQDKFKVQWLPSLGFNNGYVLIVRNDSPLPSKLSLCSRLSPLEKAGFNAEFSNRPDGFPLLQKHYQLQFRSIVNLDIGLLYPALESKKVDLISGFSTDAKLDQPQFRALEDDFHCSPRYEPSILIRLEALKKYPSLESILRTLSGKISESTMRTLNAKVEIEHLSPARVAQQWIKLNEESL